MTTSTPRRRRRRRPAVPNRPAVPAQAAARAQAPTPTGPPVQTARRPGARPPSCCDVSTTERCSLGGTIIRTYRHHVTCPVWTAR
ncbi:hypothetical protein OH807_10805 [Kitasatospora sp. NBC_01560]|uniref:hypothetical protein n=1 Tax=Kitasatospora sp. NBC_01560 TaxID=2975965 RepID=UPI00386CE00A